MIDNNLKNKDVIYPYLNGEDLISRPDQSPSRWVINFFDWPLDRTANGSWARSDNKQQKAWLREGIVPSDYPNPVAADYADCLEIIKEKVKPERLANNDAGARKYWWRFLRPRPELYSAIKNMEKVLVTARVSLTNAMVLVPTGVIFHEKCVVFPIKNASVFSVLQSSIHWEWARHYTSTLGAVALNYSPSDCFDNFPFPANLNKCEGVGDNYHDLRSKLAHALNKGFVELYGSMHSKNNTTPEANELRKMHKYNDEKVLAAYGWDDIKLEHYFYRTKQGIRFTVSEKARRELMARLLVLNHKRYKEECENGLHERKDKKKIYKRVGKKIKGYGNAELPL